MAEVPFYSQVLVANHMKKNLWAMLFPAVIHLDLLVLGLSQMVLLDHHTIGLARMGHKVDGIETETETVNEFAFHKNGMRMKEDQGGRETLVHAPGWNVMVY
jgi:hypothetical protein